MSNAAIKNLAQSLLTREQSEIIIEMDDSPGKKALQKTQEFLAKLDKMMRIRRLEMSLRELRISRSAF